MLKQRVITAVLILPLLIWAIMSASRQVWIVLTNIFVLLSVLEISIMLVPSLQKKLSLIQGNDSEKQSGNNTGKALTGISHWSVLSVISSLIIYNSFLMFSDIQVLGSTLAVVFSVTILYGVFTAKTVESSIARLTGICVSIIYGCLPWLAVFGLYELSGDGRYLLFLIGVVMGSDTGAYFGGKSYGRTKLAPKLSPNKTWEGLLSGLLVAVVFGLLASFIFDKHLGNAVIIIATSLVGAAAGALGDLVESAFKRFSSIKDSGTIFPGHGGFIDRVDGILFAAPFIWAMLYVLL